MMSMAAMAAPVMYRSNLHHVITIRTLQILRNLRPNILVLQMRTVLRNIGANVNLIMVIHKSHVETLHHHLVLPLVEVLHHLEHHLVVVSVHHVSSLGEKGPPTFSFELEEFLDVFDDGVVFFVDMGGKEFVDVSPEGGVDVL